jgi:predicted O-methyltransferase YrrM
MNIYVSLTTIRHNDKILLQTLQSMEKQTLKPTQIYLYISKEPYLLDKGIPTIESFHSSVQALLKKYPDWIKVQWCKNTGPYRKLLPLLKEKTEQHEMNCCIITIDDDTVYHPSFVERMVNDYKEQQCCINYRGFTMKNRYSLDMLNYEDREPKTIEKHVFNFHTGKGGVLYTPAMFAKTGDLIWKEEIFTSLCKTADDVWLNLIRMANNVPCYIGKFSYMKKDLTTSGLFTNFNSKDKKNTKQIQKVVQYLKTNEYLKDTDPTTFDSSTYWDERYKVGGNSGRGSYGYLAKYKGSIIQSILKKHEIQSMIDYGVGDGNQTRYYKTPPTYVGIDISPTAIQMCKDMFYYNHDKTFYTTNEYFSLHKDTKYELAVSCDVILHLTDDKVYQEYMQTLFSLSSKYVLIYTLDQDINHAMHVRFRKFTPYIESTFPDLELMEMVPNKYKEQPIPLPNFYLYRYVGQQTKTILQNWHTYIETQLMPIIGNTKLEGNIYSTHLTTTPSKQMNAKQYNFCRFLQQQRKQTPLRILEIGYNAGFSALLMCMSIPRDIPIKFTCVDVNIHSYVQPCFDRMKKDYPFMQIHLESSHTMLPKLATQYQTYDIIHIDGDHTKEGARKDMEDALRLSHKGTIIIFDDTNIDYLHALCNEFVEKKRLRPIEKDMFYSNERKHRFLEVI